MGIRQNWQLVSRTYREHGTVEALRVTLLGLIYKGETRKILFALEKPKPLPDAVEAAKAHVFKFATPEELAALAVNPAYLIAPVDIERVQKGAARCLLQMDGPRLVGYAWLWNSRLAHIDEGVHLNLPDDTIYNFKAYTNPDYRGYGFQPLRHQILLRLTEPEGVKRLFGFVDQYNVRSLHGLRKSGYVPVGSARIRRRGGRVRLIVDVASDFWCDEARF